MVVLAAIVAGTAYSIAVQPRTESAGDSAMPTSSPSTSEVAPTEPESSGDGQPFDYEVAYAYLRTLTGSDCAATAEADVVAPESLRSYVDALPEGAEEWVASGVWAGSREGILAELGGELIADRETYLWVALPGETGTFAQMVRRFDTAGGRSIWILASNITPKPEGDCG
jgi:hypothetical protein